LSARPEPDDDLKEALPYDDDTQPDDDEYLPDEPAAPRRPGVLAILLALAAVACLTAVVYAPARAWFTIGIRMPTVQEVRTGQAKGPRPELVLTVNGTGERSVEVDGKPLPGPLGNPPRLPAEAAPEGDLIRYVAGAGAVWVVVGMLVLLIGPAAHWRRRLTTAVPGIATAVAVMLTVWCLGWLVKVVVLSRRIADRVDETPGLPRGGFQVDTQPGLGLYLALGGSIAAAVAANGLSQWCLRGRWGYAFSGVGFLAGAAVAAALVRPWTAESLWKALFE
jgi:hypothetical protein